MKKILMTLTLALGAMVAIPATAQSTANTETQQTKECCKDKKDGKKQCSKEAGKVCDKEGKDCAKAEGKACCKEGNAGKKGMHKAMAGKKAHSGKMLKGDRRNAPRDKSMKRHGENPMMKGITLTEDQQQKMKALREKSAAAEKKSKAEAKAKSKDEIQKLRADFDKEVEKILDKDQLKQYQANKAELEAKRAERQAKQPKLEKRNK